MMNGLWHSNSPHAGSGYGNQTRNFVPRLKAAGYDMVISAFYGAEGGAHRDAHGTLVLPRGAHPYGNDAIVPHYQSPHWRDKRGADFVISLCDPWVFDPSIWSQLNWIAWTPIDSTPAFNGNVQVLRAARWVWSMSRHGHDQLQAAGLNPVYVPHGIDSSEYVPNDRTEARARLGQYLNFDLKNKYLVVTVAANKGTPSRKNFMDMVEAFRLFRQGSVALDIPPHPDAVWYIHTESRGTMQGEDLRSAVVNYGLQDCVLFPAQYDIVCNLRGAELLNDVYNAGDVKMLLSSEGFGIPAVEAQMAGCPVVLLDFAALSQLCFSGEKVMHQPCYMPQLQVWWGRPVIIEAARALAKVYAKRDDEQMRRRARAGAMEYDVDRVFSEYMKPAMQRVERDMERRKRGQIVVTVDARKAGVI